MSTEAAVINEEPESPPPPDVMEVKPYGKGKKADKAEAKSAADDDKRERIEASPEIRKLKIAEDATVREIVEQLGNEGSFTIKIHRKEPEYTRDATGKNIMTRGYLETVDRKIDEAWIQQKFGGGTYEITFRRKGGQYITNRVITIAGEPDVQLLPKSVAAGGASSPGGGAGEPTPIVTKALELMSKQLDKADERAERASGGGQSDVVLSFLQEQLKSSAQRETAMMARMDALQAMVGRPPEPSVEDKAQSRLVDKLIDQDTARLTAQANKYESEIRMLRENAVENERRLRDSFERDRQDQRNAHERELTFLRQSHQNEITTLKTSQEISLSAARSSFDTQITILKSENSRLDKELDRQHDEIKELRAKKDKSFLEQVKEINGLKDALGVEDSGESSTAEKIVEAITNPEAIAAVSNIFQKHAPAASEPPAQPPAQQPAKRQVVRDQDGKKFILEGGKLRPARRPPPPGTPPEVAALPPMEPEEVKRIVTYLESACQAGTPPETVVQSFGSHIPDTVKGAVRDLGGVDQFLIKVAKLPSSSPLLANQAGRNWCKKLGKALVGD